MATLRAFYPTGLLAHAVIGKVTRVVEELVVEARPEQDDAVAAILRARVKQAVVGTGAQPTIGRFTVLDRVGAGGLGTVYAAYDPVLDRRVALKVLARRGAGGHDDMLREARALAKLRHENVVGVHEAGRAGDDVWIAMEFVEGQTLDAWLATDPSIAAIGEALLAAGQGLAAAHAAGIAHGDFKPGNVLVGREGVRVADFGMARFAEGESGDAWESGGTPAYMAPERLDGGGPSSAADQFAFAATVFEAVTGKRPFTGGKLDDLRKAMKEPVPVPRVGNPRARWLAAARRGLAPDPSDRFRDLEGLLGALRPRRSAAKRTAVALAAGSAVTVAAVVAYQQSSDDPCAGGADEMGRTWNTPRADALRAAITSASSTFGEAVADRVVARLDTQRDAWVAAHRRVCEATRVSATQSDSLLDIRMGCLQRARAEVGAAVGVLSQVEAPREVADALRAVESLRAVQECEGLDATSPDAAVPADEGDKKRAAEVRAEIDRAWALYRVARYAQAVDVATEALVAAEELGFAPVVAEALFLAGTARGRVDRSDVAEPLLRRAAIAAAEVGDDRLAAGVSLQLLRSLMFRHAREEVVELAPFVRADAIRAGRDANEVDGIVGETWLHDGDPDKALAGIERALQTEVRPPRVALLRSMLGSVRLQLGESEAALAEYRTALETARAHFGPAHPVHGFHLQRYGRGQLAVGHTDAALATLSEALLLRERALGPDDRAVASNLIDLAKAETPDAARAHLLRALKIREARLGATDSALAAPLLELGRLEATAGNLPEALTHVTRAAKLREGDHVHPEWIDAVRATARVLAAMGRHGEAEQERARAAALTRRLPASHPLRRP